MDSLLNPTIFESVSDGAMYSSLSLVAIIMLLALLIERELTTNVQTEFARVFRRVTMVGIVPLLFAFVLILAIRISDAA